MLNKKFLLLSLPLLFLGCFNNSSSSSYRPLLKVDGETLDASTFSLLLTRKIRNMDATAAKLPANVSRAKDEIVEEFILSTVIKKYAKKKNISVSDAEFDEAFNKVRLGYASDLAFKSSLAGSGLLVEEWKKDFKDSLLQKKVVDSIYEESPDKAAGLQEEAKAYYESHLREYQKPAEIRLSQIVVKKSEEAQKLQKIIKSGSYTFEAMAKKYSLSPDGQKGGDIGYISKGVVPAFDVAFNYNIGQLSGVIKSAYGYHLLKLTGKHGATKISFEQARPEIIKLVTEHKKQELFNLWFKNYLKDVRIEKNNSLIEGIQVHTQGSNE